MGWPEILLIALVVILLFGARKLPEIGRGLGDGIRSFRNAMKRESSDPGKNGGGDAGSDGR